MDIIFKNTINAMKRRVLREVFYRELGVVKTSENKAWEHGLGADFLKFLGKYGSDRYIAR